MSSTSKKHLNFVSEPMGTKLVTDVPGIGDVAGRRLASAGYEKASGVFGQFLVRDNQASFQKWMKDTAGSNARQSAQAYECFKQYKDDFL